MIESISHFPVLLLPSHIIQRESPQRRKQQTNWNYIYSLISTQNQSIEHISSKYCSVQLTKELYKGYKSANSSVSQKFFGMKDGKQKRHVRHFVFFTRVFSTIVNLRSDHTFDLKFKVYRYEINCNMLHYFNSKA